LERGRYLSTKQRDRYEHRSVAEATDSYVDGVFAVLALINEGRWDPGERRLRPDVHFGIGRRMRTSQAPEREITPDCVLQCTPGSGLVGEAKLGLPRDQAAWLGDVVQLKKYDDDLLGWWTGDGRIGAHDVVALVPLSRAVQFVDFVNDQRASGIAFGRALAVVGFRKSSGVKQFMILKKEGGDLTDQDLNRRLRLSVEVPFDVILTEYRDRKFLDHKPPMPYLLQVMWDYVFTRMAAEGRDSLAPSFPSPLRLAVRVGDLTADLQRYFGFESDGQGSVEIPRSCWVREALDALVTFGLAVREDQHGYKVMYKRRRGDTLEYFGRLCWRRGRRRTRQTDLQTPIIPNLLD
jgi:hypothetical protein